MVRHETTEYMNKLLTSHDMVSSFHEVSSNKFQVERELGDTLCVLLDDTYLVTQERVESNIDEDNKINCIVLASAWLKYSEEAKEFAVKNKIGLFTMSEFYGALFRKDYWNYVKKERE